MDILFGLIVYAVMACAFGQAFSLIDLIIVVFFAGGPDLDFIPFVLLRRRFKLVSHWIIHFPLLYIPIGATLVWWVSGGKWFYVVSFVIASLAHFLHDAASAPGIQWFWPVSRTAYALDGLKFVRVLEAERAAFYERMRQNASKRSVWD